MIMWIYTIEPSLEIIQFEASETRGEYKVAYSEIIYVGFKLPKWPRRPVCIGTLPHSAQYCVDQKDNSTHFLNSAQYRWGRVPAEQSMNKNKSWMQILLENGLDLVFGMCLGKYRKLILYRVFKFYANPQ